jgi:cyanophycin synthetase
VPDQDPHHAQLLDAAESLGVAVEDRSLVCGCAAAVFTRDGRSQLVQKGRIFESLTPESERICDQKHRAKAVLAELGIPTPRGLVFDDPRRHAAAISRFLEASGPCVCKPSNGTHGDGVGLDLRTLDQVTAHSSRFAAAYPSFILEEQVDGTDLRLQAVGGVLVAACVREAAFVVGNGRDTVAELIAARQRVIRAQNPANRLELDDAGRALLRAQGLAVDAVPDDQRRVRLERIANMSCGALASDVTDQIHPRYHDWLERIARRLALRVFAVDLMTRGHRADPDASAVVLEINARPEWLHHTFSEHRTHDIATLILTDLFQL